MYPGKVPSLEDAYLYRRKLGKDITPAHEDSSWGSFDPQVTWSASGSSLVTTPGQESRTSCDTRTHTGTHSVTTIDNVSKPSIDSPSRFSVDHPSRSPVGPPPSRSSVDQPSRVPPIEVPSMLSVGEQSAEVKGKKWNKIFTWLTDPDTRDALRAKNRGKHIKKGALYDLATPIGRCPV